MFVKRSLSILEDGVLRLEVASLWPQPGVEVLALDRDDAAVVTRGGNLRRRLIGHCGEAQEIWMARRLPS